MARLKSCPSQNMQWPEFFRSLSSRALPESHLLSKAKVEVEDEMRRGRSPKSIVDMRFGGKVARS